MNTAEMQAACADRGASLRPEQYVRRASPFTVGSRWVVTDRATGARLAVGKTPGQALSRFLAGRIAEQFERRSPWREQP